MVNTDIVRQKLKLLENLQRRLNSEGCKTLSQVGIDVPEGFDVRDTELRRARTKQLFEQQKQTDNATVKEALRIFTPEQRQMFHAVLDACKKPEGAMFDIQGRAGCGKTLLLNAIGAQARLDGHLTAPTASTGLAALNQTFGLTFHRTFDVPVPDPPPRRLCSTIQPPRRQARGSHGEHQIVHHRRYTFPAYRRIRSSSTCRQHQSTRMPHLHLPHRMSLATPSPVQEMKTYMVRPVPFRIE